MKTEIVSFQGASGVWLDGLFYEAERPLGGIIHVHGSCGNFYTNRWLRRMAAEYVRRGYCMLAFNLTAHDGVAQAYREESDGGLEMVYVGFSLSEFSTAFGDIDGAVAAMRELVGGPIALQGHSMGCDRVVAYQRVRGKGFPTILLSPADSIELRRRYLERRRDLGGSVRSVPESPYPAPFSWLPIESFRVDEGEGYFLPITKDALEALFVTSEEFIFGFKSELLYRIDGDAFVFVGGADEYQVDGAEAAFAYFGRHFRSVCREYEMSAGHQLDDCVETVAGRICDWLEERTWSEALDD
jgi:pimeloyl-ACP methyl ester carboxylesterase